MEIMRSLVQLCQIQQPSRPIDINLTVCTNINFQSVIDEHDLNAYPMVIANFLRRPLPVAHRTITLKRNGLMSATAEELQWAREIKTAATAEEGLEARSDFEYLHHAIVAKGNVKKALKRIERLQAFREQYDLKGFEEDEPGKLLRACNDMFPAFLGAIGVDDGGRAVQFCEYKNFDPKALKGEKEWRDMMGSFYYMFQAMNAYPDAIRKGIVFACLCKGMGWKNFSLEVEKRAAEFYQDAYPVRMKHIYLIEAPMILNAMIDLVKVFLSKKIRDLIQTERADTFFASGKIPQESIPAEFGGSASEEASFQWLETQLAARVKNEKEFKL